MTATPEKNEEKNLNITIKNDEDKDDSIVISFSAILHNCKRYVLAWLLLAIILGGLVAGYYVLTKSTSSSPVNALVSFTYDGIEKGKNPDGTEFDYNSLKSPVVIADALAECSLDVDMVETVRKSITISPIIPSDAMNRITVYANIYENASSGQLNAAQAMLDVDWYSSQFKLTFNYGGTGLSGASAANLLNAITSSYRKHFIQTYGYNDALGNAMKVLDYSEYDYAEAVDLLDSSLSTLRSYVNNLANDDEARFRSTVTGYTFADLRNSIDTVRELDLDLISSYISQNNVTKDKDRLEAYYEYQIEQLTDNQIVYEQKLASIKESIESYEKDSIYIFANDVNTQSSTASEQYDNMVAQKIETQTSLSQTTQRIDYFNRRLAVLRKSTIGSTDKVQKTENDLARASEKVDMLVDLVEQTANDYYQNYSLLKAYNVLVPATSSVKRSFSTGLKRATTPIIGVEAILFVLFLAVVFIAALKEANSPKKTVAAEEGEASDEPVDNSEEQPAKDVKENTDKKKK